MSSTTLAPTTPTNRPVVEDRPSGGLFPDMPSNRYAEAAPAVRALCERYGLPHTSGPLHRQYAGVLATIARMSLPGGARP